MYETHEKWDEENRKEIRNLAYFKWIDAGRPPGNSEYFWDLAAKEIHPQDEEIIELNYHAPNRQKTKTYGGYKGDSYLDSGYFYAPYVPLASTPTIDMGLLNNVADFRQKIADAMIQELLAEIDHEIISDLRNLRQ